MRNTTHGFSGNFPCRPALNCYFPLYSHKAACALYREATP